MALTVTTEQARAAGREEARRSTERASHGDLRTWLENGLKWARISYLGAEGVDLKAELVKFSRERMASDLNLTRYPECRGMREAVEAKRKAFAEVVSDPLLVAFHFDWSWFCSRRLNTRFVGKLPPPAQCTDFWFGDTREGGPVWGSNRDDVIASYTRDSFRPPAPTCGADWTFKRVTCVGGVSAAALCDDEPEDLFPVELDWITHDEFTDVREFVRFRERYRDFWGPGNQVWVDPDLNFVALEKANVRMGVRYSRGWCAITACAYLTPEMNAFKRERDERSFAVRGWGADNPDKAYWAGCEARYRRLLSLVEQEHARGATVLGAAQIALDHAVPPPARICVAGEPCHPAEKLQNWTVQSFARCISGPNRRAIHWFINPEEPVPVYRTRPHLSVGDGLEHRRAEWEREIAAAGDIGLHPVGHG